MVQSINDKVKLSNGVMMPWFGMGVFLVKDRPTLINAVKTAVTKGYRSFDTAYAYCNEKIVGEAIKQADVQRENLFITTKLWNSNHGYDNTLKAFDRSMSNLGLEVLDLYLIHWPIPSADKYADSWKAMVRLYQEKRIRAIGVSNFFEHHIKRVVDETGVTPMVNQIECHPLLQQAELKAYCKANRIQVEAYSPLLNGNLGVIADSLKPIAEKYGKSSAQVALRWQLDSDVVIIPKAVHENHIVQNADIFDFSLDQDDMKKIAALENGTRYMPHPDEYDFTGEPDGN
jgi:diketogulonate reductase-like aldo/keto reductase